MIAMPVARLAGQAFVVVSAGAFFHVTSSR
jgi:hypothetical protein